MTEQTPDEQLPDEPVEARDKTLTWAPLLGALAVAAVVVLVLVLAGPGSNSHLGTATDKHGALSCPATYEIASKPWVPINPSGIDGSKHLVPNTKPSHVTVCHYKTSGSPTNRGDARLDGHRTLTGDLAAVTRSLSKVPKQAGSPACGALNANDGGSYLLGIVFATGDVWISAPGAQCQGSTNGDITTASLHDQLAGAFADGTWTG